MCKPDQLQPSRIARKHTLLLTTSSFDNSNCKDDGGKQPQPSKQSTYTTLVVLVMILFVLERLCRYILSSYKDFHPLFEVEANRMILARHIAVDFVSCATFGIIGLMNVSSCKELFSRLIYRENSMPLAGYEKRLFTYIPAAQQIGLYFLAYNIKNTFDSVIWNDGPEFIFHHLLSGVTAWGAMYPGCGHFYVIFFMGLSEISTLFLCLLANFDDDFGVIGLGEAFPITKVALGAIFAVSFVICRTIIWPFASYHFAIDVLHAFKVNCPSCHGRRGWMKFFLTSLVGLSILQVAWLGQIIIQGKAEIEKLLQ